MTMRSRLLFFQMSLSRKVEGKQVRGNRGVRGESFPFA
jgi:hypothetical protein